MGQVQDDTAHTVPDTIVSDTWGGLRFLENPAHIHPTHNITGKEKS